MNSVLILLLISCGLLLTAFCHNTNDEMEPIHRQARQAAGTGTNTNEAQAIMFLQEYNTRAMVEINEGQKAAWAYASNITDENQQRNIDSALKVGLFKQEAARNASQFDRTLFSENTKRQLEKVLFIGDSAIQNATEREALATVQTNMESRYAKGKVCLKTKCYELEPGLTEIMAESRNYDELYFAWNGWRDAASGPAAKQDYKEYVSMKNKAAVANDQPDAGAYWRSWYEVEDLQRDVLQLYTELKPFYQQLHAYVRRKLHNVYGSEYINLKGPIPAHLLGNMWAQNWLNLLDVCEPYPGKPTTDVTPALKEKGYDALRMFEVAEEFFTSLGLLEMTPEFWNNSIIEKPTDRDIVCHASAWDFFDQKDFRIKQCTSINHRDFLTIHHEMGHIQYDLQYKDQPVVFRDGANPGFHEAVGDVLSLSVSTPKHLKQVGLIDEIVDDPEADINFLMSIALDKLAFFPFAILMDQWRWGVFDGSVPESQLNEEWWNLRLFYQGIIPPTPRPDEKYFDPVAKYHIPADVPYIRYFISHVLQFQFHEALCNASGHVGPLLKCDIYRSQAAGKLLSDMLKLGASRPWPDAIEIITGQRQMSAVPLVKYFQPLLEYLEKENTKNNETIGWPDTEWTPKAPSKWTGSSSATTTVASVFTLFIGLCLYSANFDVRISY